MICALCEHFTVKESLKHASVGLGRCKANWSAITVFVPYSSEPECSKREPAKDMAARERRVAKREG